jgi:DNA transformation protein
VSAEQEYATHIVDLLESFGRCEARRMFGGYGIFHRGPMFGLIATGSLYLQADDQSREPFTAEGSGACRRWARIAFDAALRNPPNRKRHKP